MKDLIEALRIFLKYKNSDCPTHCEHDVMYIMDIDPDEVSHEDKKRLDELGFFVGNEFGEEVFMSYKFGSA